MEPTPSKRFATWGIALAARRLLPEILWGVFAAANVAAMFAFPHWQTVPFHFIWISLTLLYGVRVWSWRPTIMVLSAVVAATTLGELHPWVEAETELPELTEVPLMAAVFLAMVWYARRRQAALTEVARAAERERAFLQDASHQLRTPITVARGHAQLIQQGTADAETRHDVEVVLDELGRLATISDRLLMLAAATGGDFLATEPTRIDALLEHTADRWRPCADRIWAVIADEAVVADADPARLTVALDALIENAVNHTMPGDAITLRAESRGSAVAVAVEDSGTGINAGAGARGFRHFASESPPGRRGTGLGLPMVRAIAHAHGGDTRLVSESGHGTLVEMRLPVA